MIWHRRRWHVALGALLASTLALAPAASWGAPAGADQEDFGSGAVVTSFDVVPAADFRSNNDLDSWDETLFVVADGYITTGDYTSGAGCACAPAALPNGATAVSIVAWLVDNDAAADFTVQLKRRAASGAGPAATMAAVTTSGSGSTVTPYPDFTVDFPAIDIDGYSYFLEFCSWSASGLHRLYAVSIGYTP